MYVELEPPQRDLLVGLVEEKIRRLRRVAQAEGLGEPPSKPLAQVEALERALHRLKESAWDVLA